MSGGQGRPQVERRDEAFAERLRTRIWQEEPSPDNPYVATACRLHGYALSDLVEGRSFVDCLYLLFRGELPTAAEARLLERTLIGLINPGPRHPATRAAIAAGVGKADPGLVLPIALGTLSGSHLGAGEVEPAMRFLRQGRRREPEAAAVEVAQGWSAATDEHPAPGFGALYGSVDPVARELADRLLAEEAAGPVMAWGDAFASALEARGGGWLATGLAAAAFADLGFQPRLGAGLYQLAAAPGLLAHGVEYGNKPFTAYPFVPDTDYVIEDD